jgi:amidophosphoribosyltransferase
MFGKFLPGTASIGHNRYKTKGPAGDQHCLQPFQFDDSKYGPFGIAVNGQLVDVNNIKQKLLESGAPFQSGSDSEVIAHLLLQSKKPTIEEAVYEQFQRIPAAFSVLILTQNQVIAGKDKSGVRPLHMAEYSGDNGSGILLASEDFAFRPFSDNISQVTELQCGQIKTFDIQSRGESSQQTLPGASEYFCIFEGDYFGNPRTKHHGCYHEKFRRANGRKVYEENKAFFERLKQEYGDNLAVVPILDSGKQGTLGFCKEFGMQYYKEYLMRVHDGPKANGRSYTLSNQDERKLRIRMKTDLLEEKVGGKCIITVDDSIVRGNTSTEDNGRLKKAGAVYVVNVSVSPKIVNPCVMGIEHQDRSELIATRHTTDESLAREIGADKVIYISPEGHERVARELYGGGFCSGCQGGTYPPEVRYHLVETKKIPL